MGAGWAGLGSAGLVGGLAAGLGQGVGRLAGWAVRAGLPPPKKNIFVLLFFCFILKPFSK